jgi:glycine dehydrogenase
MITNNFISRHNGPRNHQVQEMLDRIGAASMDALIDQTVPLNIRRYKTLDLGPGMNEYELVHHLKGIAAKNRIYKSFIGMGYYDSILPGVIQRNVLENPGWYTAYTPYQAEISQGRLEALLNFQTMVSDLTALPLANASLLDEGTAAAEAMVMFFRARPRAAVKAGANKFIVSKNTFPQTIDILETRALPLGIDLIVEDPENLHIDESVFGILIQYPDQFGKVYDRRSVIEKAKENGAFVAVASDLLSLTLLSPPGEWGADVVLGSSQRFGIPMGFGGPHAAFFAAREDFKRHLPGRIIGVSVDRKGNPALRMALQTREQHIKRERATSNICTAQALLASMAGMYAVYHGPEGLREIARHIHILASVLRQEAMKFGIEEENVHFFDTLKFRFPSANMVEKLQEGALKKEMNFRYIDAQTIGISLDETTTLEHINLSLIHI